MMATTTTKKATTPPPPQQCGPGSEWAIEAAQRIVDDATSPDERLDPGDLVTLRMGGIEDREIPIEVSRSMRARQLLPLAGTSAERETAAAKLVEVEAAANAALPQIEAQISELEKKRDQLTRNVNESRKRIERYTDAVTRLRDEDILPKYIRSRLARARQLAKGELYREASEGRTRLKAIQEIVSWPADSPTALDHARLVHDESLCRDDFGNLRPRVDPTRWEQYRRELLAERVTLEARLAEIGPHLDVRLAEADELRNYYVDKLG